MTGFCGDAQSLIQLYVRELFINLKLQVVYLVAGYNP